MRLIARLCCITLLGLVLTTGAWAQSDVLVKAQTLTLRKTASSSGEKVDTLITYQPLRVLERSKDSTWAKVKTVAGKSGWVMGKYLSDNCFVRVDSDKLNVRRGPGSEYAIIMNYGRNMPLLVQDVARNGWLKVMDYDGDRGWVHPSLVKLTPSYVITDLAKCNVRQGPGTEHPIVFTAERGVILRVTESQELKNDKQWLKVQSDDGDQGWISAKIVFGWLDVDDSKKKS